MGPIVEETFVPAGHPSTRGVGGGERSLLFQYPSFALLYAPLCCCSCCCCWVSPYDARPLRGGVLVTPRADASPSLHRPRPPPAITPCLLPPLLLHERGPRSEIEGIPVPPRRCCRRPPHAPPRPLRQSGTCPRRCYRPLLLPLLLRLLLLRLLLHPAATLLPRCHRRRPLLMTETDPTPETRLTDPLPPAIPPCRHPPLPLLSPLPSEATASTTRWTQPVPRQPTLHQQCPEVPPLDVARGAWMSAERQRRRRCCCCFAGRGPGAGEAKDGLAAAVVAAAGMDRVLPALPVSRAPLAPAAPPSPARTRP